MDIRKTTRQDVEALNMIRNQSSEYLHDNRKFTLEQTITWFDDNRPDWYSLFVEDRMVGYFRISNYSPQNRNLYIGADIEESSRGKGLGYQSYIEMMKRLFNERKLNKISLEVLETNQVAFNLYVKIGFIEEGRKRQEIWRNGSWVDSIVMSITRKEFMVKHHDTIASPCVGICSKGQETCSACGRTLDQISSWKQYEQHERREHVRMILNIS